LIGLLKKLLVLALIGFVLVGCASQAPAGTATPTQGGAQASVPTQSAGTSTPVQPGSQGSGSGAQAAQSLAMKIASGQAFDCDYTDVQTGSVTNYKGKGGKLYVETTNQETTVKVIAESTTKTTTPQRGAELSALGCDWIKATAQDTGETEGQGYEKISQQVQNVPDAKLTCNTPSFTEAIFTPDGSVCTMDEFKNKMMANVPQTG
jgi:hypothetical protein